MFGVLKSFFLKEGVQKSLKVFAWTVVSAIVTLLISLTGLMEFDPITMSLVNTVLYGLKKFIDSCKTV